MSLQAVLVLKVTLSADGKKFCINMPYVCMKAPDLLTDKGNLAGVTVYNETLKDIELSFLPAATPLKGSILLQAGGEGSFDWKDKVPVFSYGFLVGRQATDAGGHVEPANGTIDIVVMG